MQSFFLHFQFSGPPQRHQPHQNPSFYHPSFSPQIITQPAPMFGHYAAAPQHGCELYYYSQIITRQIEIISTMLNGHIF